MSSLLSSLNPSQSEAASVLSGPLLILAGAGSGKTRVLTYRIAHLMANGIPGDQILAVTFTNKAANEMKERVEVLLQSEESGVRSQESGMPLLGTFHSICVRMLRRDIESLAQGFSRNFIIFDSDDSERLIKLICQELELNDKEFKPKAIKNVISGLKNQLKRPKDVEGALGQSQFAEAIAAVYPRYQKKLIEHNALDFDDLLQKTVEMLEQNPPLLERYQQRWQHVLVDEYQDTNFAQYRFIHLLVAQHKNLCVVGDDHQSIYRFRGADYRNILDFEKDFPDAAVVKLEQNYRSTKAILQNANTLIAHNRSGRKKKLWTENPKGQPLRIQEVWNEKEEGNFIANQIKTLTQNQKANSQQPPLSGANSYSSIAILYRMNAQSRAIEEALMRAEIPYQIIGGTRFFDRREIKDMLAYLRLVFNPKDDIAFLRIINVPARKIGSATLDILKQYAQNYQLSLYEVLEEVEGIPELNDGKRQILQGFYQMIKRLHKKSNEAPLLILIQSLIDETDYLVYLDDGTNDGQMRQQNVRELLSVATRYEEADNPLEAFLEGVALVSDIDQKDDNQDAVTLMTIHASKGLEFPVVFLPGWEDGIFPSQSASLENADLEEERRLGYVALTRAEEQCYISHTRQRMLYGRTEYSSPSAFLSELDESCCERESTKNQILSTKQTQNTKFKRESAPSFDHPLLQAQPRNREEALFGRSKNETDYATGQRIRHPSFGEGTIIQIQGDILSVAFSGQGIQKIVASSSPIEIIESS